MKIDAIDHFVLIVKSIEETCHFYSDILGMEVVTFGNGRTTLHCGDQKINLHPYGNEYEPKAETALPGTADFCLITSTPVTQWRDHLINHNITIVEEISERTGARGKLRSIYVRDPDMNLVEISNYVE